MKETDTGLPPSAPIRELHARLRELDRMDWWLWCTAIVIFLLLCLAVFSLALPAAWQKEQALFKEQMDTSVRALFGSVLLFSTFALYQQLVIKSLRTRVATEICIASDLQGRAELVERLEILDPLTGVFKRRFGFEYLRNELDRAERQQYPVTVLMIDLADFTSINARHGRTAGDFALAEFARHLKKAIRSSDLPVRMGGDKFMVVLPECGVDEVLCPLARVHGCVLPMGPAAIELQFAAGFAQSRRGELGPELLRRADEALYHDKKSRPHRASREESLGTMPLPDNGSQLNRSL